MIVDVEATTAVRQAEVGAVRTMIERVRERHDLRPARLAADTAYGSAEMLDCLVNKQQIAPHIPVINKSGRDDGTFARSDFTYDPAVDTYRCPTGKTLERNRRAFRTPRPDAPPDDTSRRERKKVEMLFAHLKRILRLDRLRFRDPQGARDEFHLAATAQNPRKLAKLIPPPSPETA